MIKDIKVKLNSIDKWMEYTFIQTLSDYVYCEMLRKYDKNFDGNLKAYQVFLILLKFSHVKHHMSLLWSF